jgi:predicted ester cyclase
LGHFNPKAGTGKNTAMEQDRNRSLIHRFYYEMWNHFDKTIIADLLTDDLRFRGSLGEFKSGRDEFGEYVDFIQRTFPDFSGVVEETISEGDKAFAKLTWQGTHCGELAAPGRLPGPTPRNRPVMSRTNTTKI